MKVKQISQDEARVLCLFTQKLKYCSSSFKEPSLKEKPTKATNKTYLPNPKWDSTKFLSSSAWIHMWQSHTLNHKSHTPWPPYGKRAEETTASAQACCSEFQLHQGNGINNPPPGSIQKQEGNNWCENHLQFSYTSEMWRGSYAQGWDLIVSISPTVERISKRSQQCHTSAFIKISNKFPPIRGRVVLN